jgi:PIN domain nuclease of toxin-antitoxin system
MTVLVDASVVLAVLLGEAGGLDVAEQVNGARISTVNLSEVYRRLIDGGMTLQDASTIVDRLHLDPVPFDSPQAIAAAGLRPLTRKIGASFADRACLALALQTGLTVLTADRQWDQLDIKVRIQQIRG